MKAVFLVQGEGRGHMTQAIALVQILNTHNIQVSSVIIGSSGRRQVPDYFLEAFSESQVVPVHSPNFVTWNNRGINVSGTIFKTLLKIRKFYKSIEIIKRIIEAEKPDFVINFYEPLCGLYGLTTPRKKRPPVISIAHQYLTDHILFKHPVGMPVDKIMLKSYTRFTAIGSDKLIGLSFYSMPDQLQSNLVVAPPLLRQKIKNFEKKDGDYFLCYVVNSGYLRDLRDWHQSKQNYIIHIFSDERNTEGLDYKHDNFKIHALNENKFLTMMAGCKGLISTAGFESICEAMYFGKPAFMVPVEGHYEQLCNAHDGLRAGAGIFSDKFNIDTFINWLPDFVPSDKKFRDWEQKATQIFMNTIEDTLSSRKN